MVHGCLGRTAVLAVLAWMAVTDAAAAGVASPYDPPPGRRLAGAAIDCPSPPPPARDLMMEGFYADRGAGSSVIDPGRKADYEAAMRPVRDFEAGLIRLAGAHRAGRPGAGACALGWLGRWAAAGAYLGAVGEQGGFVRKWGLAPAALAFRMTRDDPSADAGRRAAIESWLRNWADVVRADYDIGLERDSRRNNHAHWAAWSVMAAAQALDDRPLFEWAIAKARAGIGEIAADGTLPLEMARKSRALHYHLFAVAPLVMVAEIAARNGVDLWGAGDGALHRLVERTLAGLDDPAWFAARAGQEQAFVNALGGDDLAWLAPYARRFPGPLQGRWLGRHDRLVSTRLGGDLRAVFAEAP